MFSMFKKKTTNLSILFIILFISSQCILLSKVNAEDIRDDVFKVIEKYKDYKNPRSDMVTLLSDEYYYINSENTIFHKQHILNKIVSDAGRKNSTTSIPYNSYFQKLKINVARTIQPDGTIVNVSPQAIKDESPYVDFPMYSDMKYRKVTFPAVSVGSVMELDVEYEIDRKGYPGYSSIATVNNYVLLGRLSVETPKNKHFNYNVAGMLQTEPTIKSTNTHNIYSWNFNNRYAPGAIEPFLPTYMKFGPYISFSTIKDWDEVQEKCKNLLLGQDQPDEHIITNVKRLTKELSSKEEIIEVLYNYVSQEIQYVAIHLGLSAWRPYPAIEVLKNGYGDCKGKSALLISMLNAAGIKAYYALVMTASQGVIEKNIPTMNFNHVIVAVPQKNSYLFLDPTANMLPYNKLPFEVQGSKAFVLDKSEEFLNIPIDSSKENSTNIENIFNVKSDGSVEFSLKQMLTGQQAWYSRYWFKNTPQDMQKQYFQNLYSQVISNTNIREIESLDIYNLKKTLIVEIKGDAHEYSKKAGDMLMFKLPCYISPNLIEATSLQYRLAPLFMAYPHEYRKKIIINTPKDYKVKYIPEPLHIETPVAFFNSNLYTEGNTINIETNMVIKEREISVGKYPMFRNLVNKARSFCDANVILEKI